MRRIIRRLIPARDAGLEYRLQQNSAAIFAFKFVLRRSRWAIQGGQHAFGRVSFGLDVHALHTTADYCGNANWRLCSPVDIRSPKRFHSDVIVLVSAKRARLTASNDR